MKTSTLGIALFTLTLSALAQPVQRVAEPNPPDGVHRIVERGPHHRTWEKITQIPGSGKSSILHTNSYVELQQACIGGLWTSRSG